MGGCGRPSPHRSAVFSSTLFLMVWYFKKKIVLYSLVTTFVTKLCSMKVISNDKSKNSYVSVIRGLFLTCCCGLALTLCISSACTLIFAVASFLCLDVSDILMNRAA